MRPRATWQLFGLCAEVAEPPTLLTRELVTRGGSA